MTGPLTFLNFAAVAMFTAGAFIAMSAVVLVSGHFPRSQAKNPTGGFLGSLLAYASLASLVCLIAVLVFAGLKLPLAVAIVAAGLAILAAPFIVEPIPAHIRESRGGLVAAVVLCAVMSFAIQTNLVI